MTEYKWLVKGWREDDSYLLTAEEMYRCVKNDYRKPVKEWFSPPGEIWEVCNLPSFPEKQANAIKDMLRDEISRILHE